MSKFGVGVGEDFPVDEQAQETEFCGAGTGRGEAIRKWHQMRSEWRARKRAMREQFRREFAADADHHHRAGTLALAGLAVIGLAALLGRHHHSD